LSPSKFQTSLPGNTIWIARIDQHAVQGFGQSQPPVGFSQEHHPSVARYIPARKTGLDLSTIKAWKTQFFLRTIWHGEVPFCWLLEHSQQ